MSKRLQLPALVLLAALGAAACTSGGAAPSPASVPGSPGASGAPAVEPSPSAQAGIIHPTGADEVVLRLSEEGGFVPAEWLAARLPYFTLYGDGRVVFIQTMAEVPVREDNVFVGYPLRTAKLSEEQVQELLAFALTDGGLGIAKNSYQNPLVADAPTTSITINAENDSKTVSVVALGMEGEPGPDSGVLRKLALLGERLRDFDQGGSLASDPYTAPSYRAVILEQEGVQGVPIRDWPWEDIAPEDFTIPKDPMALPQGTRTLTTEEVEALGIEGYENGISSGVFLAGADGKTYSLVIRPLLPDEKA